MPVIFSTHALHPRATAMLERRRRARRSPRRSMPARWPTKARDADIVIVRAPLPPALFERRRRLRAAIRHGAGLDMIPVEAATKAGVLVANVPGASTRRSVAEHVFFVGDGAAPALPHDRPRPAQGQAGSPAATTPIDASELAGRTIGIIGIGSCRAGMSPTSRRTASAWTSIANSRDPRSLPGRCPLRRARRAGRRERHRRALLPADAGDDGPDQPRPHRAA